MSYMDWREDNTLKCRSCGFTYKPSKRIITVLMTYTASLLIVMMSYKASADVILGISAKYGPNGYQAGGYSSSSSSSVPVCNNSHHHPSCNTSVSSSVQNGINVSNRIQAVPGLSLTTVPNTYGISLKGEYYLDNTLVFGLGIRL